MTSVGMEPMTSGLDLPLLCQLSYEVGQRKPGTIKVVNRGEKKIWVHKNVNRPRLSAVGPRSLVSRAKLHLIQMSWVRFPPRS